MKWYLDFGHGGKDSGAIGPTNLKSYYRYRESSMNIFIRNLKPRKNQQN